MHYLLYNDNEHNEGKVVEVYDAVVRRCGGGETVEHEADRA